MGEFHFTWQFALKLFSALLILGVWLMSRQQASIEKSERQSRAEAMEAGRDVPARRIVPASNYVMVAFAIVFLLIALFWGNKSTL